MQKVDSTDPAHAISESITQWPEIIVATTPYHEGSKSCERSRARTCNLRFRRPTSYPLDHTPSHYCSAFHTVHIRVWTDLLALLA